MRVPPDEARIPRLSEPAESLAVARSPSRGLADQSLARTIGRLAPVTLLAQLAGFVYSIALARVIGSSTATDAYFLALSVPAGISMVMLAGTRQGAMPSMTESFAGSAEDFGRAGSQLVSSVVLISAVLSIALTGVTLLALPLVVTDASERLVSLVEADLVALTPLPLLGALTGVLGAIQTVRGNVTSAVAVLALEPIAKTVAVVALGPSVGAASLIIGQLAGSTLAAATLWALLRRGGVALRLVPTVVPPFVRGVVRLSTPLIISQSVLQANPIVDRAMATALGAGAVTQLELGVRLFFGATALIGGTLIAPLTGTWSARLLHDGWDAVRAAVIRAIVSVVVILPPLIVLGIALRSPVVTFLYGGGAYSDHALQVTADVFGMLVLGLPANVLIVVLSSLFVVRRSTIFPMLVGMTNVVLNVALNFALRPPFGAPGIALSTSLTMTLLLVAYARSATVRWDLRLREVGPSAARAALAGATLAAAAVALAELPWGPSRSGTLAHVLVVTVVVLALHAAFLLVTREPLVLAAAASARRSRRPTIHRRAS
jgi:putative peptidoglycan lipid II flippase